MKVFTIKYKIEDAEKLESFMQFMHTTKGKFLMKMARIVADKNGWDFDRQLEKDK